MKTVQKPLEDTKEMHLKCILYILVYIRTYKETLKEMSMTNRKTESIPPGKC